MDSIQPVSMGVVGLGGYGGSAIQAVQQDQASPHPHVRLHAVCSNDFDRHPEAVARLRAEGVKLIADVDTFLAEPTEALWLPLPIPLHRPYTERALAAGKAVLCEKPAAGSVDDVDAMIAARDRAKLPTIIGFQDIYDPNTLEVKQQILNGKVGKVNSVSVWACWPRGHEYYTRTDWAGAFKRNGAWVMDSPANNALAHYLNIALFLAGPTPESSAQPVAVEAELYRVNPIENFDTISMRLRLDTGATALVLFTHACERTVQPEIILQGPRGRIVREVTQVRYEVDGHHTATPRQTDHRLSMVKKLAHVVRGVPLPSIAAATLEVARAQVAAVNGASEAATIRTLEPPIYKIVDMPKGPFRVIPGIEAVFESCVRQGKMLHESALVGWSVPAGRKELSNYRRFAGPLDLQTAGAR